MNETIIVTTIKKKEKILREQIKENKLYKRKFMTPKELKERLSFSYDDQAILYVMKYYQIKYEVAKNLIENIYEVEDKQYQSPKLNKLVTIKRMLESKNLLKKDETFKDYIKNKTVIFYEIDPMTMEIKKMIQKLKNQNCSIKIITQDQKNYIPEIYELETMNEEIEYVVLKIIELLKKNIPIDHIKLCNITPEYHFNLNRIFKLYHIPLESLIKPKMINLVKIKKLFLQKTSIKEQLQIEEYQNDPIYAQLIQIINQYSWCANEEDLRLLLKQKLKQVEVDRPILSKSIQCISLKEEVSEEDYIFLLNANQKEFPIIYKDEEYITDNVKSEITKETTIEKQQQENEALIRWIKNQPHLTITYKKKTPFHSYYPSHLLEIFQEAIQQEIPIQSTYSTAMSKQKLAKELDDFIKYGKQSEILPMLFHTYQDIPYRKYENSYQPISKEKLKHYMKNHFLLSYSAIDQYYKCGFRYYAEKILKLVPYEETMQTRIGNLFHYGLENKESQEILNQKLAIEKAKESTAKEKYFLTKLQKEFEFVLEVIKEQEKEIGLKQEMHEKQIKIPIAEDASFVGIIDKIVYNENFYALIDYKTGNANNHLKYLTSGLNMQLPIYLYLSSFIEELRNAECVGFYLQKIWLKEPTITNQDYLAEKKKQLKLSGYSINDPEKLEKFDLSYKESRLIEGMKVKNDGNFYYYSKILSKKQMEAMKNLVNKKINEAYQNIKNANFKINPKESNSINLGCEFCPFEEVCFKTPKDKEIIKEEKDFTFLGGE